MKQSQEDKYSQVKEEPDVFRELLQDLENEMVEEIDRMTIEQMKKLLPGLENFKDKDETK
jgi:hypothetical protein